MLSWSKGTVRARSMQIMQLFEWNRFIIVMGYPSFFFRTSEWFWWCIQSMINSNLDSLLPNNDSLLHCFQIMTDWTSTAHWSIGQRFCNLVSWIPGGDNRELRVFGSLQHLSAALKRSKYVLLDFINKQKTTLQPDMRNKYILD